MNNPTRPPFAPNITPPRPAPAPLSSGQRAMGWLLVLTPVLAAISLAIAAAQIPAHRPEWHDYPVWLVPHLFLVPCHMVITTIPAFACYWILCKLGYMAEKRGMSKRIIWPGVLLLCTLAGCARFFKPYNNSKSHEIHSYPVQHSPAAGSLHPHAGAHHLQRNAISPAGPCTC